MLRDLELIIVVLELCCIVLKIIAEFKNSLRVNSLAPRFENAKKKRREPSARNKMTGFNIRVDYQRKDDKESVSLKISRN